jgi:hypothetical protein
MPFRLDAQKLARFAELCKENGLDPNNKEFGSPTLLAWLWFNIGLDEAEEQASIASLD